MAHVDYGGVSDSSNEQRRVARWQHVGALGLYCALTAVMVTPLVFHPASLTAGWEDDNFYCIRLFWWAKHVVVDRAASPFWDPSAFFPHGHEVASGEMSPANTYLMLPVTMWWGPLVAYNVTLVLSFVMTGFGTYLWTRWLTGSVAGALVAGVIAAFLPFRFAHLVGHLTIVSTHWVPFALYSFERFLAGKRPKWAAALGVTTAMVALCSWYLAYSIALMLPLYAAVRSRPWRVHWDAAWWRGIVMAMAVAALLVVPFMIPYMMARSQHNLVRSIAEMEYWSLNVYDFWLPNTSNPVFQPFMKAWFPTQTLQWVERNVTFGVTAFALALVAVHRRRLHPAMTAVIAVWVASYLIALGPTLHFGDRPLVVPMPWLAVAVVVNVLEWMPAFDRVRLELLADPRFTIPMPSRFLFLWVPLTDGMRVMARFALWTGIMTAALAGWGTMAVLQAQRLRAGARRVIPAVVVAVVCALVLFESRSEVFTMPVTSRGVDRWLAQQPKDAAVIELPLEQALRPIQNYYKTVHEQPTVFGRIGDAFEPDISKERRALLADFPSDRSIAVLKEWRTRYVLFTPAIISGWPDYKAKIDSYPALTFDREIDGVMVYLVR